MAHGLGREALSLASVEGVAGFALLSVTAELGLGALGGFLVGFVTE